MLNIFLLNFILLLYSKQILSNNEIDISSNIDAIDKNIIQQIGEHLKMAKKCTIDPEKCVNMFLNEMANYDELARFKGIYVFCNGNSEDIRDPIRVFVFIFIIYLIFRSCLKLNLREVLCSHK